MCRVNQTESYLNTLPQMHQGMLGQYRDHLTKIRHCIDENHQIIRKIIRDSDSLFENDNSTVVKPENGHTGKVRTMDLEKVCAKW